MMFGMFLAIASGLSAGHVARSYFAAGRAKPLRSAWVVSIIGACIGAGLDIVTKIWVAFGLVSLQQTHEPLYVLGTCATYVGASMYITMAYYYGRWIPFTVRARRRRRL